MTTTLDDAARGKQVLVTGATGYVAGWLVRRLLDAGAIVHGTVRDPSDKDKVGYLLEMAGNAPGSIKLFQADLLQPGSFDQAMQGCEVVFHTASPFLPSWKVQDPQKAFVEPALKGTKNVLESANRTPSVTRVVLTSSTAAVAAGPADPATTPGGIITEACWNTTSSLENGGYLYSKVVAERAAWEAAKAQDRWRLVVINPGFVLGPGVGPSHTSASFDMLKNVGDGSFEQQVPPIQVGMVDVRDVAEAHFRAGFLPDAQGRHIVTDEDSSLGELAEFLKVRFGEKFRFPKNTALPAGASKYRSDNTKSKVALGMEYRPFKEAAAAMFERLIEAGELN